MRPRSEAWQVGPMPNSSPQTTRVALEQARAELETILRADAHWRALGQATQADRAANRAAHERALAGNAVYRAWVLLVRAIGELQAAGTEEDPGPTPRAPARRPKVELRQVLERIRDETPLEGSGPKPAAAAHEGSAVRRAAPAGARADIDIEEAAVSFIVREPAAPAPQPAPPLAPPATQAVGPQAGASDAAADRGEEDDSGEAEVTIVPRR
jgi:hypothetical protein